MKQITVTCVSQNLQTHNQTILVQFNMENGAGGHQLHLSPSEASEFKLGEKYTVTFDKA